MRWHLLVWAMIAWITTSVTAEETSVLEIPEFCSATQVWLQTILNCPSISDFPQNLIYSSMGIMKYYATWDSVNMILQSIPFHLDNGQAIDLDIDGDGINETELGILDNTPYVSWTSDYGILEQNYDCIQMKSMNTWDVMVCGAGVSIPNIERYDCMYNLNDAWKIHLNNWPILDFQEENYSFCFPKDTTT